MQANDIMTTNVVSVTAETTVDQIASLLMKHKISGVPVIGNEQQVVGVVSEGDLLRRVEGYNEARESWWLDLLSSSRNEAADFVKAKGRYARDIMTAEVISVDIYTPVGEIAKVLERHHIKRVPVLDGGRLVGIVSRANLLHALASRATPASEAPAENDRAIRSQVLDALKTVPGLDEWWINVTVVDGCVELWGVTSTDDEAKAAQVATEAVAGVKKVNNYLGRIPASWDL